MNLEIKLLNADLENKYDEFLLKDSSTLLYASNKYRKLLRTVLDSEDYYFVAIEEDKIVGVLPAFLKKNINYGNVLNSLPFYGSNGSVIEYENNFLVREKLLSTFYQFAQEQNCCSATVITSPLDSYQEYFRKICDYTFIDERIGQLIELPAHCNDETLMNSFHSKTRNMIRKAQKSNLFVSVNNDEFIFSFLYETHKKNMETIGGLSKPEKFFRNINHFFSKDIDYKIWVATTAQNQPIAALLCFYFNETVEYFTPVVVEEYRSLQPLSLLIFEAIKDAINLGFKWWNWGGTWLTQDSVYHFKKRWGTTDKPYYYYTKIFDEEILNLSREILLQEFPYFYILPFNKLLK